MQLTGTFILPADAVLQPVSELTDEFRRRSGSVDGEIAVSRKRSRSHSKVVDAAAAELIRHFREPCTIAVAVARFSRSRGDDPDQVLEEALPLLRSLIGEGLLVGDSSEESSESLHSGDELGDWTIVRCIQALEDTEVYQVQDKSGQWGALKIARAGNSHARSALEQELRVFQSIDLPSTPKMLFTSESGTRLYLVTEWFGGVNVQTAAAEIRRHSGPDSRRELLGLCGAILDAYACLHEQGVLHGDIHARNLLVDGQGRVKILDFGASRFVAQPPKYGRAGVSFFFEPEFALAVLDNTTTPPTSVAGEQYSLASLLYLLITGSYSLDFSLERLEMLRQIATAEVVPFAARRLEPWPEVERLLAQALEKDPAQRHGSIREFHILWEGIETAQQTDPSEVKNHSQLREICAEVVTGASVGGLWMRESFKTAPTVSVNHGCAGLAYALQRIACSTDDGELLAVADSWYERAVREIESEGAFFDERINVTPVAIGRASLYHQPPGVFVAQALVAAARGDRMTVRAATDRFISHGLNALKEPGPKLDLTLGLAGSLLGSGFLLDALNQGDDAAGNSSWQASLRSFAHQLYSQLWTILDGYAPIGEKSELEDTGMAHGWAGLLYASLCWCSAAEEIVPPSLQERLDQLEKRGEPVGRGLRWLWGTRSDMPGWCNGSAGFVFLWTEAYKALGESRYLSLAERAAWSTWESPASLASLCCGLTGQSYALLNAYRHSGNRAWLRRAETLAEWAASASLRNKVATSSRVLHRESLYYGVPGVAVLAADLARPLEARMPFFERE